MSLRLIFLIGIVSFLGLVFGIQVEADYEVYGWAWGDNIGWISFNCTNTNWCATSSYGVKISTSTADVGNIKGYAWSRGTANDPDGVGWIDFDPPGPYPEDPQYSACINLPDISGEICEQEGYATNTVSGWARVVSAKDNPGNAGGWEGWIKLRGTTTTGVPYGVYLSGNEFKGWAWGGNPSNAISEGVVGWISFNCANPETGNICASKSNYKVMTTFFSSFNSPPYIVPNSASTTQVYCNVPSGKERIHFSWQYDDKEGDPQSKYEFRILDAGDNVVYSITSTFSSPLSPPVNNNALVIVPDDGLSFGNITYHWQVKLYDDKGNDSGWIDGGTFTTPLHAYPYPDFTFTPSKPAVNEVVTFDGASSVCYDEDDNATTCNQWSWDFDNGATSTGVTATTSYSSADRYYPTLTVTDSDGYSCPLEKTIEISLPLPQWKEVAPTGWLPEFLNKITGKIVPLSWLSSLKELLFAKIGIFLRLFT